MKLIAKKPCSFAGKQFYIGDEIPTSFVANPKAQEKMGVLAIISDGGAIPPEELQEMVAQVGEVKFEVLIHAEEGDLPLLVTNEELSIFTDIRQIDVQKAEDKQKISDLIQKVESEGLLTMLDALDGRKFVKGEAQARAQALSEAKEEEEGENPDDEDQNPSGDESDNSDSTEGENPDDNLAGDE